MTFISTVTEIRELNKYISYGDRHDATTRPCFLERESKLKREEKSNILQKRLWVEGNGA
jgi:hypothetical protein